jgi:hypothetical protein
MFIKETPKKGLRKNPLQRVLESSHEDPLISPTEKILPTPAPKLYWILPLLMEVSGKIPPTKGAIVASLSFPLKTSCPLNVWRATLNEN